MCSLRPDVKDRRGTINFTTQIFSPSKHTDHFPLLDKRNKQSATSTKRYSYTLQQHMLLPTLEKNQFINLYGAAARR